MYDNVFDAENYGIETVLNFIPSNRAKFESSCSWFTNERTGRTNARNGEPFNVTERDNPIVPEHFIRLRFYLTFNPAVELSFNGTYRTAVDIGSSFIYDRQFRSGGSTGTGIFIDEASDKFRLDFKLAKKFNDGKASIFIRGKDIFNTGVVERLDLFLKI